MADPAAGRESAAGHRVELVSATHPDAAGLLAARRAAHPHWAAGWDVEADDAFVVVYEADRPVAGAVIRHGLDTISRASRLCGIEGQDTAAGSALLDGLEALAREAGSTRLRLDSSAFLDDASVPWQRHGYVTGPPYNGDADVEVWVERALDPVD
jgi:hypothetical protein